MAEGIDVTVAAIIERDGRFLLVEERSGGQLVLNQPAGHLEPGESLLDAVTRETREETGFSFTPSHVVGFYLWHSETAGTTFLRVAFCGMAEPPTGPVSLDDGIVGIHWLSPRQLRARASQLRSPMVMCGFEDFVSGRRYSLDCLSHLGAGEPRRHQIARG